MGFGTLFIGYFFLINISYFSYTDIVGTMVMLMGLYQLSAFDKNFKYAVISDAVFSVFAFFEIIISVIEMFGAQEWITSLMPYVSLLRYAFIFVITLFILRGIGNIAHEVEATELEKNAKASVPLSAIFIVAAALELPFFASIFGNIAPYVYFAVLLAIVVFIISNLMTIYKAYMQICMPDDENHRKKSAGSGVMDKFYDSIEEKSKAYAEYKLEKAKRKADIKAKAAADKQKNENKKRK